MANPKKNTQLDRIESMVEELLKDIDEMYEEEITKIELGNKEQIVTQIPPNVLKEILKITENKLNMFMAMA